MMRTVLTKSSIGTWWSRDCYRQFVTSITRLVSQAHSKVATRVTAEIKAH